MKVLLERENIAKQKDVWELQQCMVTERRGRKSRRRIVRKRRPELRIRCKLTLKDNGQQSNSRLG